MLTARARWARAVTREALCRIHFVIPAQSSEPRDLGGRFPKLGALRKEIRPGQIARIFALNNLCIAETALIVFLSQNNNLWAPNYFCRPPASPTPHRRDPPILVVIQQDTDICSVFSSLALDFPFFPARSSFRNLSFPFLRFIASFRSRNAWHSIA